MYFDYCFLLVKVKIIYSVFAQDRCTCQAIVGLGLQKPQSLYKDLLFQIGMLIPTKCTPTWEKNVFLQGQYLQQSM